MVVIPLAAQKNEIRTLKTGKITLPGRRLDVMPPVNKRLGDQTVALQKLRPTVTRDKEYMRHTTVCLLTLSQQCSPTSIARQPAPATVSQRCITSISRTACSQPLR